MLAEFERELIVERTKAGLAAARSRGRKGGRPRKMDKAAIQMAVAALSSPNAQAKDVAKRLGITTTTLYEYLNGDGTLKALGQVQLGCRIFRIFYFKHQLIRLFVIRKLLYSLTLNLNVSFSPFSREVCTSQAPPIKKSILFTSLQNGLCAASSVALLPWPISGIQS